MEKIFDSFSGMLVEKGQESETQKAYDRAKAWDKSGVHEVIYIDVDGQKAIETIHGSVQKFDDRVRELKQHGCKIVKQLVWKNWSEDSETIKDAEYEVTVITKENKHEKHKVNANSIEEAESKVKTDGTIVNVVKAKDVSTVKDASGDEVWENAKIVKRYKTKRGEMFYIKEAETNHGKMYLVTSNTAGQGGVVEFSLAKAEEWAEKSSQMHYLNKKYGATEGYKKWMAEGMAADANTVEVALETLK